MLSIKILNMCPSHLTQIDKLFRVTLSWLYQLPLFPVKSDLICKGSYELSFISGPYDSRFLNLGGHQCFFHFSLHSSWSHPFLNQPELFSLQSWPINPLKYRIHRIYTYIMWYFMCCLLSIETTHKTLLGQMAYSNTWFCFKMLETKILPFNSLVTRNSISIPLVPLQLEICRR